jgi:hypothetical protein
VIVIASQLLTNVNSSTDIMAQELQTLLPPAARFTSEVRYAQKWSDAPVPPLLHIFCTHVQDSSRLGHDAVFAGRGRVVPNVSQDHGAHIFGVKQSKKTGRLLACEHGDKTSEQLSQLHSATSQLTLVFSNIAVRVACVTAS